MSLYSASLVYAALLVAGGAMGYAKGSLASLIAGAGSGAAVAALEVSLSAYPRMRSPIGVAQCVVAGSLLMLMGQRFMASFKVMPAGLVAGLSLAMLAAYASRLLAQKGHTAW